jgi:hypothetical protein
MTILFGNWLSTAEKTFLQSEGPNQLVIPSKRSEVEGPAVQRTFRGNVFRQSVAQRRHLLFTRRLWKGID